MAYPTTINLDITTTVKDEISESGRQAARLQITATAGAGEDAAIFVYQAEVYNRIDSSRDWFFSHICSPAEFWDLPIQDITVAPVAGDEFVRADSIDLHLTSYAEMDSVITLIQHDIQLLLDALKVAEDGTTTTTSVTITPST